MFYARAAQVGAAICLAMFGLLPTSWLNPDLQRRDILLLALVLSVLSIAASQAEQLERRCPHVKGPLPRRR
jgi:hypothetical protein